MNLNLNLTRSLYLVALVSAILFGQTGCGPSTETKFNYYYQVWDNQLPKPVYIITVGNYVAMPAYRSIVDLGPKAIPHIWAVLEKDPVLANAGEPNSESPPMAFSPKNGALLFAAAEIGGIDLSKESQVLYPPTPKPDDGIPATENSVQIPYDDPEFQHYILKLVRNRLRK